MPVRHMADLAQAWTRSLHGIRRASRPGTPRRVAIGAEALLREHPDALVCGLAGNGLIVPVPAVVGLWGQGLIEGRALIDNVVAADRSTVVRAVAARRRRRARPPTRSACCASRRRWTTLHFLDLRELHGVLLGVVIPSDEAAETGERHRRAGAGCAALLHADGGRRRARSSAATRRSREMFGYTEEELLGNSVLDQIHPEDQGRAVEGWLAVLSTRRDQQTRLRRKRKDGSWMWVDTTLHNSSTSPPQLRARRNHRRLRRDGGAGGAAGTRGAAAPPHRRDAGRAAAARHRAQRRLQQRAAAGDPASAPGRRRRRPSRADLPQGSPARAPRLRSRRCCDTLTDDSIARLRRDAEWVLDEGVDQRHRGRHRAALRRAWRRALMSMRALLRPSGEVSGAITCVLDITDSARARQELERRATFDALTRCHNRSSILGTLAARARARGLGEHRRRLRGPRQVQARQRQARPRRRRRAAAPSPSACGSPVASSDHVGRLGGDEFLVVLRDIPRPEVAMRVADRICEALCGRSSLLRHRRAQRQRRRGLLRRRDRSAPRARQARRHRDVPVKAARPEPARARASRLKQIPDRHARVASARSRIAKGRGEERRCALPRPCRRLNQLTTRDQSWLFGFNFRDFSSKPRLPFLIVISCEFDVEVALRVQT